MVKERHNFTLCLKHPNPAKPLDFLQESDKLRQAEARFNARFLNDKKITITDIQQDHIKVLLETEHLVTELWREISSFSSYLYRKQNFAIFSNQKNRLFTIIAATSTVVSDDEDNQDIDVTVTEELADDVIMSDEEVILALKSLVEIQNLGLEESKYVKKQTIAKIKKLLHEVL